MAIKEGCELCVQMDAISFLSKMIEFGLEFKTEQEIVDALRIFGAQEGDEHLHMVAKTLLEEYL